MAVAQVLLDPIRKMHEELGWQDHGKFVAWLREFQRQTRISDKEFKGLLARFPDPRPRPPVDLDQGDGVESYLRDPPDPGPLAKLTDHGWITDEQANVWRLKQPELRRLLGIVDPDAANDVQENSLHILGRCSNPRQWKANRAGLVYGMVQSGKTASMISLMALAKRAGYRLFILLAGDKSSLRDQTQGRVSSAFDLVNGVNPQQKVDSPTYDRDFRQVNKGYTANFRYVERFTRNQEWTTIIVVKKNTNHLQELTDQIKNLHDHMKSEGRDFAAAFPTLVLDDEADYASQNTDVGGAGSSIHNDIVRLCETLPRHTYVGYTATPQACLAANPSRSIGYPKDFFWLLEPYADQRDGGYRPRTYLGAWDVFWNYDGWLIHQIGRDQWPHYEKDRAGRQMGIYVPSPKPGTDGSHQSELRRTEIERLFLEDLLAERRPEFASLTAALLDFMIGCGIRWWLEWRKSGIKDKPDLRKVERDYPYHAAMVHLSEKQENQELVRLLVQKHWDKAVAQRRAFKPNRAAANDLFRERWNLQADRTRALSTHEEARFDEVAWFIDLAIEIASRPINDHRVTPYRPFAGSPYVYLLNSSDVGMELKYASTDDAEVRTKKAAIVVGGNILSRGLTIEGLCVTVFGRTARMPMWDATLQMGRWFGHKMSTVDLISLFMQREIQDVLKQVAEADRHLRLQIKDAIMHSRSPMQVLVQMKNSPFFRITSPAKSKFLQKDKTGIGFSGRETVLNQPSFEIDEILHNRKLLDAFQAKRRAELVHNRADLYRDVGPHDVIKLLRGFKCPDDAAWASFKDYARYLEEWLAGDNLPSFPKINVAVWRTLPQARRRLTTPSHPTSPEAARKAAELQFGPIVGGQASLYRGDAFLDRDEKWHREQPSPSKIRQAGDPILITFYRLHPNYVTRRVFPQGATGPPMAAEVYLQPNDARFVGRPGLSDQDLAIVTFAAWTPSGGPLYGVMTNRLIDPSRVEQRGREQLDGGNAEE